MSTFFLGLLLFSDYDLWSYENQRKHKFNYGTRGFAGRYSFRRSRAWDCSFFFWSTCSLRRSILLLNRRSDTSNILASILDLTVQKSEWVRRASHEPYVSSLRLVESELHSVIRRHENVGPKQLFITKVAEGLDGLGVSLIIFPKGPSKTGNPRPEIGPIRTQVSPVSRIWWCLPNLTGSMDNLQNCSPVVLWAGPL